MAEESGDSIVSAIPKEPKVTFDSEKQSMTLDFRSVNSLPFDPDTMGVNAFRVIIFAKGKGLHVPDQPGKLVVSGDWTTQLAITLVHFAPSTHRAPELLINFVDYGYANPAMAGMNVETLLLPLLVRKGVFQDAPRLTSVKDITGFSAIDISKAPWSMNLKPCLAKQKNLLAFGISSQRDIMTWLSSEKMEARITLLAARARTELVEHIAGLASQDASAADKQKAVFEAKLSVILDAIGALPPSAYDVRMSTRIIELTEETAAPEWLLSPMRAAMSAGTSEYVHTKLVRAPPQCRSPIDTSSSVIAQLSQCTGARE